MEQHWEQIKHYCSYQERCHQEVKYKLIELGARGEEVEEFIAQLISENYLNEERFATAYARGHFKLKNWGKKKISYQLKQKGISPYLIQVALKEIAEEDYQATLEKLFSKRITSIGTKKLTIIMQQKIYSYLSQKGYESALINELIVKYKSSLSPKAG